MIPRKHDSFERKLDIALALAALAWVYYWLLQMGF